MASLTLAGALLGTAACKDDDEQPPPVETPLSAMAQKGLAIVPFQLDTSGLSQAEKEQIGVGSYLVNAASDCTSCHQMTQPNGPPQYLGGGIPYQIDAQGDVVYARNLTTDPDTGMKLTEAEFIESMRTGKDYKSDNATEQLIVMPWSSYRWMSTTDLKSIYAYLKKVPAIKNAVPADLKGAAAAAQPVPFPSTYADGEVSRPLPAESTTDTLNLERGLALQPLADPAALATLSADDRNLYARGSYLVNAVSACSDCHTNPPRTLAPGPDYLKINTPAFLTGGYVFPVAPGLNALIKVTRSMSANLLGADHGSLKDMTYDQFHKVLVDGDTTKGGVTRKVVFPMADSVKSLSHLNEDDIKAIFTYLKNQTLRTGSADKLTQPPARYCAQDTDCTGSGETCNVGTHECVGAACTADFECGACQTCSTSSNTCVAPEASSPCLAGGI